MINVFVAFPRWCESAERISAMQILGERFERTAILSDSSTVYQDSFDQCGNWDSWIENVTTGVHPITRSPKFHVFISPNRQIGKATATIFRKAIEKGKECFLLDGKELIPVLSVEVKR